MLPDVVARLSDLGLVEEDGGAKCTSCTNVSEAPLIVQKADGYRRLRLHGLRGGAAPPDGRAR